VLRRLEVYSGLPSSPLAGKTSGKNALPIRNDSMQEPQSSKNNAFGREYLVRA
jgi:hypothetical protein